MMEQKLQTLNANQRAAAWAQRISACRSSSLSVRAWCRENQLSEKTYYYWQHRLFKLAAEQHSTFTEITPVARRNSNLAATIRIGKLAVDIYDGADAETVGSILHYLTYAE